MPNGPAFTFDPRLGRYRDPRGRMLSSATIRAGIDAAIRRSSAEVAALTQQLRTGAIDVAAFERALRDQVKSSHLAAAMVAKGGKAQMQPGDWGRVGAEIKFQYQRLAQFASGIADGSVSTTGAGAARAAMYATAPRATFAQVQRLELANYFDLERNVLGAAEHCVDCLAASALGWVPIGTLPAIGERACLVNDRCHLEFKNSSTGAISA